MCDSFQKQGCTPVLEPCVELPLPDEVLMDVIEKGKDWALMHGAGLRSKANFNPDALQVTKFDYN